MSDQLSFLLSHCAEMGISLRQEAIRSFETYLKELKAWNEKFNLTAIKDDEDIVIKHFLDSLTPLKLIKPGSVLLDIGSGAGFPGIPLKTAEPSLKVTLLDSVNKKVIFMRHIISELGLTDIEAIHGRTEDFARIKKRSFDVVISRALASLSDFIALGEPFLTQGGVLIAMKGKGVDEEVKDAAKVIKKKGINIKDIKKFSLPLGKGERGIVILERTGC